MKFKVGRTFEDMVAFASAEGRAVTRAATLASSHVVATLLYASLLARYVDGRSCYLESCNFTGQARPPRLPAACSCHDYCHVAGDCCTDKTPSKLLSPSPPADAYRCISLRVFAYPVRMVIECPSPIVDVQVANFCATPISDRSQPDLLLTPVTDRVSGLTYRNVYCARCWGVAAHRVNPWLWKFTCKTDSDSLDYDYFVPRLRSDEAATTSATTTPMTTTPGPDSSNISSVVLRLSDLCGLVYTPPPDVAYTTHNCTTMQIIDSCANPTVDDDSQRECTSGAWALVFVFDTAYKNAACAACSTDVPSSYYWCLPYSGSGIDVNGRFDILLSPSSGCCVAHNGNVPQSRAWPFPWLCRGGHRCSSGDSTAQSAAAIAPLAMLPITLLEDYRQLRHEDTASSCTYTNNLKSNALSVNVTYAKFSNDTLVLVVNESAALCIPCTVRRCTNFTATTRSLDCAADGQLHQYEYPFFVVDGDVAVACTDIGTNSSDSVVDVDAGCPAIPAVVSIVSLCLSEVCLIAYFAAFALIKDQRRFPQELILNQSVAFFLAFLLFLLRPVATDSQCTAIATTIHYFLLSAFAWTALFAVQVTRVLSPVPLRSGRSHFRWRLVSYILGWVLPLACVGLALAADAENLDFKPDYGPPQCFISSPLGSVALFVAPMLLFLLIDVAAYCYTIVRLIKVARQTAVVRKSHEEKLFLCIKLVLCLGLLWISGAVAAFTGSQVAYCIFTLFNSWQGVFTFIIFACKRDNVVSLRHRSAFFRRVRSFNSSTATTRSTISTIQFGSASGSNTCNV